MTMDVKYTTTVYEDEYCIVRVHKPILTEEEYKRREDRVRKALVRYCLNTGLGMVKADVDE